MNGTIFFIELNSKQLIHFFSLPLDRLALQGFHVSLIL